MENRDDLNLISNFKENKFIIETRNKTSRNYMESNKLFLNEIRCEIKPKLGRKRKMSNEKGIHDKYSEDNILSRIKNIIFNILLEYNNEFISTIYNNNLGYGINIKQLLKINQLQKRSSNVEFNKKLLNKTQKEIFSENISKKYTGYPFSHNKDLINRLMNEEDKEKKYIFKKLFNLKLIDCIKAIRGSEKKEELEGIENKLEIEF